jgi:hypothetical protein
MSDPLATYLEDHLAGASAAVDLLESLRDQHASEPLGPLAAGWLEEITDDRKTLLGLIDRVEHGPRVGKEAAAWLAEKVSRVKLGRISKGDLGTFQALETLSLGIQGKRALWKALAAAAPEDPRLGGPDYDGLIRGAESQFASVEEQRLEIGRRTLSPPVGQPARG